MEFENLGDTVEFGCVQRACGAEPLSLLRFVPCGIENLCHALETDLAHLFVGDDLETFADYGDGRFHCRSRYYEDFPFYVYTKPGSMSVDAVTARERKKTEYLRSRFLADLRSGTKIYVRKGSDALHDLRRLQRALASHGPNLLLLVGVADADHPAGTVERLEPGLLRGFVSRFAVCLRPEPIDVLNWVSLCRAAYEMARPDATCIRSKPLHAGSSWALSQSCTIETTPVVARSPKGATHRVDLGHDRMDSEPIASCTASIAGLEANEMFVFSAWVYVPFGFAGRRISIGFDGVPIKHEHPADLRLPNRWQLIWASGRRPRERQSLVAMLCVADRSGVPIHLSGWTLEKGSVPSATAPDIRERFVAWRARFKRSSMLRRARAAGSDGTPRSIRAQAEMLIANGALVEADDVLSKAVATFPDDASLAKLYATSAHNSGRYFAAINRWSRALALDEGDPMCFAGFASNLREHLVYDRARDVIGSALARFPDDMVVLTEGARIAEAADRLAEALPLWEKAIAIHGPHPDLVAARNRVQRAIGA